MDHGIIGLAGSTGHIGFLVQQDYIKFIAGQFPGQSGTDNAGTDDDHVGSGELMLFISLYPDFFFLSGDGDLIDNRIDSRI